MTRVLVVHKGEGRVSYANGKRLRSPASYQRDEQVRNLLRYALSPARQSKGRERVAGVVDGLGLGLGEVEILSPSEAAFVADQLIGGVPRGRRKIRHVILAVSGKGTVKEQVKLCRSLCQRYVTRCAPGCAYIGIIHDDHFDENGRGLHVHLVIRNSDAAGRALDWNRDDLRSQQGMEWASGLDVVPTRGTGISPPSSKRMPYPKSKNLEAINLGKLNPNELETYITAGKLVVGRRDKKGNVTSVVLNGRRIRLSTARALAEREQRMAAIRGGGGSAHGIVAVNDLVGVVGTAPTLPARDKPERRGARRRSFGLGFDSGGSPMAGRRQRGDKLGRGAVRDAARRVGNVVAKSLTHVDDLGRGI